MRSSIDHGDEDRVSLDTVFDALAHPARRYLLQLLRHDGALAMDLSASVQFAWNISAARASQHLGVLRRAELVTVIPCETTRHYRFEPGSADAVVRWIDGLGKP
ncbi:helix-turn-helix transcriptional regulator [Demequina sp. NBRC 110056]|uniref:ArsR/SmtB family transcription factor n=1 Tax=Demequina sp. NBRC 110056 TaxID=1570345 RepID=UPI0009FFE538|nr:helix-turn-helix domain-containing protein [Demequina sp. NBRC 110056]